MADMPHTRVYLNPHTRTCLNPHTCIYLNPHTRPYLNPHTCTSISEATNTDAALPYPHPNRTLVQLAPSTEPLIPD